MRQKVALIGSGTGPWISTVELQRPELYISGLRSGTHVVLEQSSSPTVESTFEQNGTFSVERAKWMRVRTEGKATVVARIRER